MPVDANAAITITAFAWVPDFARGYVKDLRARWALEEAGLSYRTRLLEQGDQDKADYRALQPFGQVPVYEEAGGPTLFESAAIVHHVGQRCETLLPAEPDARARAVQWMFAAMNSIDPFVGQLAVLDLFYADEEWAKLRRPSLEAFVGQRLAALAGRLGDGPWLDGDRFTAGDLMMVTVLRDVPDALLAAEPRLIALVDRGMARSAFQAAMAAQLADFRDTPEPVA